MSGLPTHLLIASFACLVLVAPARAQDPGCRGVSCSRLGTCIAENGRPLCLCDEGYAAVGLECVFVGASRGSTGALSDGHLVVAVAAAEAGREVQDVGRGVTRYPYQLRRYVAEGEGWCSDFVSWVYRAAGVHLTGGSEGGWMIGNNVALMMWFQRQGWWIGNGGVHWGSFRPQPGDYIRMRTSGGGHSAIVRYVDGDTLYTVEGNVGGLVRLRRYPNFRANPQIHGFGALSGR